MGFVLNTGPEILVPVEGGPVHLGLRVGAGLRVGLIARDEGEGHSTVPALALVGGFLGHDQFGRFNSGGYLELRPELVVARRGGLLQPSVVAYGIGGAMLRGDGVVPYFGLGIGWDLPMFAFDEPAPSGGGRGWNFGSLGGGSSAALLPAAIVAAAAIIGFVLIGRVELRYYPMQVTGGPAMAAVLIGFGF